MNNQVYGLTTGQASPTADKGMLTKSTPTGSLEMPVNPIALGLISGATYISRGFSGDLAHLAMITKNALTHKGFSLVDVLSPCVTYNKIQTYQWLRERVYKLEDEKHNPRNLDLAIKKAYEWNVKIPIGVFYKGNQVTYEDEEPGLKDGPLVERPLNNTGDMSKEIMKEFI